MRGEHFVCELVQARLDPLHLARRRAEVYNLAVEDAREHGARLNRARLRRTLHPRVANEHLDGRDGAGAQVFCCAEGGRRPRPTREQVLGERLLEMLLPARRVEVRREERVVSPLVAAEVERRVVDEADGGTIHFQLAGQ